MRGMLLQNKKEKTKEEERRREDRELAFKAQKQKQLFLNHDQHLFLSWVVDSDHFVHMLDGIHSYHAHAQTYFPVGATWFLGHILQSVSDRQETALVGVVAMLHDGLLSSVCQIEPILFLFFLFVQRKTSLQR
ncbi:hypothetical protein QOT17_013906 [Balamuthia mandrillaris]